MKNIIFSHESDIDGIGNIILGKLAFDEIDYLLIHDVNELEVTFRKYMESGALEKYNHIYVTDLALYDPSLTVVAESILKDKIHIFDHHKRAIDDNMDATLKWSKVNKPGIKGKSMISLVCRVESPPRAGVEGRLWQMLVKGNKLQLAGQ